jgi:hypothetical protein
LVSKDRLKNRQGGHFGISIAPHPAIKRETFLSGVACLVWWFRKFLPKTGIWKKLGGLSENSL